MKLQNKNKNDGAGSKSCGFKSALFIYYLKDVCVMRLKTHEQTASVTYDDTEQLSLNKKEF